MYSSLAKHSIDWHQGSFQLLIVCIFMSIEKYSWKMYVCLCSCKLNFHNIHYLKRNFKEYVYFSS